MRRDDHPTRACPVCSAQHPQIHCDAHGQRFIRCSVCRSLYLNEPPDWTVISSVYQSPDYQAARGHGGDAAVDAAKEATTSAYLKLLEGYRLPGRAYLEVGCSAGAGLTAAVNAGWQVQGVEVSESAAARARQRPGVGAVHNGTVCDVSLPASAFDVVTMFDVIEHIDPPHDTVRRVYELLRDGGLFLVLTPDADSWSARLLGRRWPHLFPEHVICFSRPGLKRVLQEAGFDVLRSAFAWKRVNLDMLARHAVLHGGVVADRAVRIVGSILPASVFQRAISFNLGEFYVIARKPAGGTSRSEL